MAGIFADFNLKFDPWRPDFGLGFQPTDEADSPQSASPTVNPDVEVPEKDWKPIEANDSLNSSSSWSFLFVDGVRRLELRTLSEHDDRIWFGGLGTISAGAIELRLNQLNRIPDVIKTSIVKRYIFVDEMSSLPDVIDLKTRHGSGPVLTYERKVIVGTDPEEAINQLQVIMRAEEGFLAASVGSSEEFESLLIIADGPLSLPLIKTKIVGYIKSLYTLYLDHSLHHVLYDLNPGQRTPLFRILPSVGLTDPLSRYSCYLRLATPLAKHSSLAGLARIEVSDSVDLDDARRLADACAFFLPKFSAPYGRDPRAPSNLIPLSALENNLKHQMGDMKLIRRILEEQFY